jgi:hypothetical protein
MYVWIELRKGQQTEDKTVDIDVVCPDCKHRFEHTVFVRKEMFG